MGHVERRQLGLLKQPHHPFHEGGLPGDGMSRWCFELVEAAMHPQGKLIQVRWLGVKLIHERRVLPERPRGRGLSVPACPCPCSYLYLWRPALGVRVQTWCVAAAEIVTGLVNGRISWRPKVEIKSANVDLLWFSSPHINVLASSMLMLVLRIKV